MRSGYTATSYGQPSQLPQLYRGFGLENAIFYRGTNKHILTPLFDWVAPDGSTISTLRTFDEVTRTNWFFYVHGPAVLGKGLKDLTYTYDPKHLPVHMADMGSYEKAFTVLVKELQLDTGGVNGTQQGVEVVVLHGSVAQFALVPCPLIARDIAYGIHGEGLHRSA